MTFAVFDPVNYTHKISNQNIGISLSIKCYKNLAYTSVKFMKRLRQPEHVESIEYDQDLVLPMNFMLYENAFGQETARPHCMYVKLRHKIKIKMKTCYKKIYRKINGKLIT